jgi:hypothetical protein
VNRILPFVLVLGACAPDIIQNPPPSGNVITVEFDPGATVPVVPVPNDLAKDPKTGLVVVPPTPGETPAQREFEVNYLGALSGFPFETNAQVSVSGDLNPSSVNPMTVLAFDLGVNPTASPSGMPTSQVAVPLAPQYVAASKSVVAPPPMGGWTRAHTYALVLVGGNNGLRGAKNENVIGSQTWALVSSSTPLVTCQDLTAPDCRPAVDVIPSNLTDPGQRLQDQTAKAIQLEQLRRLYAPILDALGQAGTPRANIPIAWTFSIVDAGEVTFDPANNVIPFPNDILRSNGKVALPNPTTFKPLSTADCNAPTDPQVALTCGLNTLDGFSTLAPPISENSNALGAVVQANLDPASLTKSVGLIPFATKEPAGQSTQVNFTPCLNCLSSTDAMGNPQTTPQQLQWKVNAPLDEQTTYFAYVTGDAKDDKGKNVISNPVFALLRLTNPLYDGTHATVNLITDAQGQQLEPLRLAMKPGLDALEKQGTARTNVALAFAFTTQSEASILDELYGFPNNPVIALLAPDAPLYVADATATYQAAATAAGVPFSAVGKVYVGAFTTPVAVTGPSGTLNPGGPVSEPVSFVLYLPASAAPASGYPLTIFGHGFTRSRNDSIAIANSLALAGQATLASDVLFHGERSSCTGSASSIMQSSDDAACADPVNQKCNEDPLIGRCVARVATTRAACAPAAGDPTGDLGCAAKAQGRCVQADQKCEGGDFLRDASGRPQISGWNIFSLTNFFATRDNFRQQVIDLSQLVRVIKGAGTNNLSTQAATHFDLTKLGYVGQSLGGILGTLFNAVSPDTTNVVLNVPGGALVQIILNAPSFAADKASLFASLAKLGLQPGTPGFDQFLGIAQWILDEADPASMGYRLTHSLSVTQNGVTYMAPNPARKAFIQFIEGDETVPNIANLALVAGANRSFLPTPPSYGCASPLTCYEFTEALDMFDATTAVPSTRHGFLLAPPQGSRGLALTTKAQLQAATFLATGQLP